VTGETPYRVFWNTDLAASEQDALAKGVAIVCTYVLSSTGRVIFIVRIPGVQQPYHLPAAYSNSINGIHPQDEAALAHIVRNHFMQLSSPATTDTNVPFIKLQEIRGDVDFAVLEKYIRFYLVHAAVRLIYGVIAGDDNDDIKFGYVMGRNGKGEKEALDLFRMDRAEINHLIESNQAFLTTDKDEAWKALQ